MLEFLLVTLFQARVGLGRRVRFHRGGSRRSAKCGHRHVHQPGVLQIPRGRNDDVVRRIPRVKAFEKRVPRKLRHRFGRAQNRQAQGMSAPEILREHFVDHAFGIVLVHLDLFEDYLLFLGDVRFIEPWTQHQVGEHVEGDRQVLVEHFRVEASHLLCREGIEHPAQRVHRLRDLLGRAPLGALEHHVLDEVRDPVAFRRFAA
jgi:hypothetical protein